MREIKFRAWDEGDSRMITNFDESEIKNGVLLATQYDYNGDSRNNIILMQYTGLKDKNGKEIYEGDIMYVAGTGNMVVIFRNGSFVLDNKLYCFYFHEDMESDIENVIGNIYENPELLKEAKG